MSYFTGGLVIGGGLGGGKYIDLIPMYKRVSGGLGVSFSLLFIIFSLYFPLLPPCPLTLLGAQAKEKDGGDRYVLLLWGQGYCDFPPSLTLAFLSFFSPAFVGWLVFAGKEGVGTPGGSMG